MRDVEIVEPSLPASCDLGGVQAASVPRPRGLPRWQRHWRGLTAGAAVLVLVLASVAQGIEKQHRLTRLAAVPGVVAALDGPPRALWADFNLSPDPAGTHEVGGLLVGTWRSDTEAVVARGVDARSGSAVWSVPLAGPRMWGDQCAFADGAADGPHRAMLACIVVDAAPAPPADYPATMTHASAVHLSIIDPRTGHILATYPATPNGTISSLGTDIAIASVVDGQFTVARFDPRTGRTVWATHPTTTSTPDAALTSARVSPVGDGLLLDAGARLWQLSAAGDFVHKWSGLEADDGWSIQVTPGGHVLRTTSALGGATTTDLWTGVTFAPPGQQVMTGTDDGSASTLLLTSGPALTAWDLGTGAQRWTTDGDVGAVVVLEGTVYSVGARTLRAQDVQSGAVRWAVPVGSEASTSLATDGRSLLVLDAAGGSGGSLLRAVDLQDGSTLWTAPLAEPPGRLLVLAHHLFTTTGPGRMVAIG
ncbi:MAG: PQQ-binding-like beta-propeller repeat protein [Cellulomonas sp.]